eukprot:gnl/TRDRNA2_/TRDRNA2_194492_c0_seq1.p1 gnl/TRDRNA2_/TRDRNA2_194492_c0~~gnl/TRDRNA2_/TRDRNA2_194492_c0_seq1.p1  ORF type:complete len:337 (-),score=41.46 gnl/TRDRNA2_/TRDRNA2_194492_c0_seq1:51-941(-)
MTGYDLYARDARSSNGCYTMTAMFMSGLMGAACAVACWTSLAERPRLSAEPTELWWSHVTMPRFSHERLGRGPMPRQSAPKSLRGVAMTHAEPLEASPWHAAGEMLHNAGSDVETAAALLEEDRMVLEFHGENPTSLSAVGKALRDAGTALQGGWDALEEAASELSAAGAAAEDTSISRAAVGFEKSAVALRIATGFLTGQESTPCSVMARELRADAQASVVRDAANALGSAAKAAHESVTFLPEMVQDGTASQEAFSHLRGAARKIAYAAIGLQHADIPESMCPTPVKVREYATH